MDVLINSIMGIILQCICTPNHHVVDSKYITILFVNNISMKLEKKQDR